MALRVHGIACTVLLEIGVQTTYAVRIAQMHRYWPAEANGLDRGRDAQASVGRRYPKGNDPYDHQKHQNQYCFQFFTRESIQPMLLFQPSGKGLPSARNTGKQDSKS